MTVQATTPIATEVVTDAPLAGTGEGILIAGPASHEAAITQLQDFEGILKKDLNQNPGLGGRVLWLGGLAVCTVIVAMLVWLIVQAVAEHNAVAQSYVHEVASQAISLGLALAAAFGLYKARP